MMGVNGYTEGRKDATVMSSDVGNENFHAQFSSNFIQGITTDDTLTRIGSIKLPLDLANPNDAAVFSGNIMVSGLYVASNGDTSSVVGNYTYSGVKINSGVNFDVEFQDKEIVANHQPIWI